MDKTDKTPRNRRIAYVAIVAILCLIAGLLLFRDGIRFTFRSENDGDEEEIVEIDVRPRLTATRVVGRRQGERQFELDAGSIGDDEDWVLLEQIENGLLYRDGEVFIAFRADAGRWHRPSNNLMLEGNVVLEYDGRVDIRTEELEWRAKTELVIAPGPVLMLVDGDEVTAGSMEADLDDERVRLEDDVHIVRLNGDQVHMKTVVYWLAEDRMEGFGRGRLVFGGHND